MHSMKAAMQHTIGQKSDSKSSKYRDGSAHPHGGSDREYYHTVTAVRRLDHAKSPMTKMMDLFRHRSNSATSDADKRKAVRLFFYFSLNWIYRFNIDKLFVVKYGSCINIMEILQKATAMLQHQLATHSAMMRRASTELEKRRAPLIATRRSDGTIDPHYAAILFRDSRGVSLRRNIYLWIVLYHWDFWFVSVIVATRCRSFLGKVQFIRFG